MSTSAQDSAPRALAIPPAVRHAVSLMWFLVALSVLRLILSFGFFDTLIDDYVSSRNGTAATRDQLLELSPAPPFKALALIFGLFFGALELWLAFVLPQGKRWARTAAIVVSVLVALGGLLAVVQTDVVAFQAMGLLSLLAGIALVVLLLQRPANVFFAAETTTP